MTNDFPTFMDIVLKKIPYINPKKVQCSISIPPENVWKPPFLHFYTTWKHQKTGIEIENWAKIS